MPDAKSLLPGRAFRSEHAQLRPEPHSIASHGPAPMDPLQTTRMRNGVLYAAEWPCCHDPLRLSLGSEDPFYIFTTHAFGARGCAHPHPGGRARRARRVRAPPPRAGRRAPNAHPPPQQPLPPHARSAARAAGLPRRPSARVCPSLHAAPNLLDVSFAFAPAPLATPNAGKAFFTPASTLPSLFHTYLSTARAPRPRNPPPTRMHTAP